MSAVYDLTLPIRSEPSLSDADPAAQAELAAERGRRLRNSLKFEHERSLRGLPGETLVADIMHRLAEAEGRKRALKMVDREARSKTVNVLLANLALAALNRVNPRRYIALPLRPEEYANTGLSYTSIELAYRLLQEMRLATGQIGVGRRDFAGEQFGMRSRLRATSALRELLRHHGVQARHIRNPPKDVIYLAGNLRRAGPEPAAIAESRQAVERVNELLASAELHLPEDAWQRIAEKLAPETSLTDQQRMYRQYVGDVSAKRLYRSFSENWEQGGRLYGGWWMGVPKEERRLIEIDGEATVELDYGQLHPTILFAKINRPLDFDPYEVGPISRELGKETFMRLLNRTPRRGGRYIRKKGDAALPPGITAAECTALYKRHMAPVQHFFGLGMGLRLQREDSDLALAVLAKLTAPQVLALPIHDSFIVKQRHEPLLRAAMIECFTEMYRFRPVVK